MHRIEGPNPDISKPNVDTLRFGFGIAFFKKYSNQHSRQLISSQNRNTAQKLLASNMSIVLWAMISQKPLNSKKEYSKLHHDLTHI